MGLKLHLEKRHTITKWVGFDERKNIKVKNTSDVERTCHISAVSPTTTKIVPKIELTKQSQKYLTGVTKSKQDPRTIIYSFTIPPGVTVTGTTSPEVEVGLLAGLGEPMESGVNNPEIAPKK